MWFQYWMYWLKMLPLGCRPRTRFSSALTTCGVQLLDLPSTESTALPGMTRGIAKLIVTAAQMATT